MFYEIFYVKVQAYGASFLKVQFAAYENLHSCILYMQKNLKERKNLTK